MAGRRGLILAGAFTFFAALVVFFPARVAYQWFAPPTIKLASISGSIWRGRAGEASTSGLYLRDLQWRLRFRPLLTGRLGFSIEAHPVSGFLEGNIAIGVTGAVSGSDLRGSLPLQSLQQAAGIPGLGGTLNLQINELLIEAGVPAAADGSIEVVNLVVPLVHPIALGGYRAEFFMEGTGIVASIEDTDGVVDFAGTLRIATDRSYQLVAQIAAKSVTPPAVRQQMELLGPVSATGQRELRLEGEL